MTDSDRNTPRFPEGPTGALEVLVVEAEQEVDELKTVTTGPSGVVETGPPPDEPPRHLPTIGRFGPYDIVGRLAIGGMAEILLAREEAAGAGSRYLVVKRILPEFEREPSFVEMFLDEARVMMRLRHPNVCHVYKFGQQDGAHFIAMEWVNGASLGKLIRRARKAGGLPVAVTCKIIGMISEALDHAHNARDEHDRPLGIVHRDVTPDNLMISYDGSAKLLDFGIAKADARAHKTQAGVVKGKFAYMAPEQCRAKELDHRVDVFALGVCLYEALTGRPLYRRETEFETMEAIVRGPIPTLADRMTDPPPELERIIAKCLAKKPEDRFSSAGELQEALDRFLANRGEVVTARRLKELMGKLFREEMKRGPTVDTTPFGSSYHFATSDGLGLLGDIPGLESLPVPVLDLPSISPPEPARENMALDNMALDNMALDNMALDNTALGNTALDNMALDNMALESNTVPPYQGSGALAPLGIGVPDGYRPGAAPAKPRPVDGRPAATAPPRARPPEPVASGGGALGWVLVGVGAVALVAGGAYLALSVLTPAQTEEPAVSGPAPVLTGNLVIDSQPSGATLFVDGREIGPTPATLPRLTTGSHRVRLVLEGHVEHQGDVEVRAGQTRRVDERLTPLTPEGPTLLGRLSLTSEPRAQVYLGSRHLGETPLANLELPAGVLALELVTPDGTRHRRGVMVREADTTSTHLDLTREP